MIHTMPECWEDEYESFLFSVCVGSVIAALWLICAFSGNFEKKNGALSVSWMVALEKFPYHFLSRNYLAGMVKKVHN